MYKRQGNVVQRVPASELSSVLKGFDAGLIDQVEVLMQPPLRYDPDGNTAMIILHTSSVFKAVSYTHLDVYKRQARR